MSVDRAIGHARGGPVAAGCGRCGSPSVSIRLLARHANPAPWGTKAGLRSRAAGLNPAGATFAGVPLGRTLVIVAMISGGFAGLAGAIEVMGVKGYVTTDLSPGYGYSGIVVAMLANLNPLGVVLAALFTATMFVGADGMSRSMGIPTYIADVTVALSLISMLIAVFFTQYRIRR